MKNDITDIDLPDWITCFRRDGYGFDRVDPVRRTTMNSGRIRAEQWYDFVPSFVNVRLRMRQLHTAAFEAWHRDVIDSGQSWFNARMRSPRDDHDVLTVRFDQIYNGPGLMNNGEFWEIDARLEVFEHPMWPDGFGKTPELIFEAECLDLLVNYYIPLAG